MALACMHAVQWVINYTHASLHDIKNLHPACRKPKKISYTSDQRRILINFKIRVQTPHRMQAHVAYERLAQRLAAPRL